MKIEHLECFIEAVHCQSISSAAKKLFMSQSSLSSAIQSLEQELGCVLLRRSAKGIILTDDGVKAMERFQKICDEYHQLKKISSTDENTLKIVNVCGYPCMCQNLGSLLAPKLKEEWYGDIMVSIVDVPEKNILTRLKEGVANIAVGLCKIDELETWCSESKKNGFILEELRRDGPYCLVHPDSKLANKKFIHFLDLQDEFLASASYCLELHNMDRFVDVTRHIVAFNNPDAAIQAVADNHYVTIVPGLSISNDARIQRGDVKALPFLGTNEKFVVFLIYQEDTILSKSEKLLRDDIREIISKMQLVSQ